MARVVNGRDESINEQIVYDSQEEQDQWPDSQPRNSAEDNSDNIGQTQSCPKVYGKQQKVRPPPAPFLIPSHLMPVFPKATSLQRSMLSQYFQCPHHLNHKGQVNEI